MADTSKLQSSHLKSNTPQHQVLEEEERISSEQTLDNPVTNCSNPVEHDDIENVDNLAVPYIFNLDPFSPHNASFFVPSSSSSHHHDHQKQVNSNSCSCCSSESESESDSPDSTDYPDYLYGHDEEYDQMDFITDLFDSRGEVEHVSSRSSTTDVGINVSEADYIVDNTVEELGLGLRVASIDSDSDTEELSEVSEQNDDRIESTDLNLEHFWVDEKDGSSSVIDRIEEISVSSDGEATVGVLEWEILLAVNNLERDLEFATEETEGFVYTPEFDALIGQFVETVRALRGGPPAAKSVIDNLPMVALKLGDAKGDDEICAVCKDEILIGEKVTQLPCKHVYHGECIVPWLSIRNTCPVCRFELPTDDVDYERSKNRENDDELRVGYGLDLLP